jgi:hypothetical protein
VLVACQTGGKVSAEKIFPSLASNESDNDETEYDTDSDVRSFRETAAAFAPYFGKG